MVLVTAAAAAGSAACVAVPLVPAGAVTNPVATSPAAATTLTGGLVPAIGLRTAPRALPERLTHLGSSSQVIVVQAANWATSHANLVAWQKSPDGTWQRVLDRVPARVGWNGFAWASRRVQNSGETPAGTFRLLRGFGIVRPPGVSLRYRVVDASDWWPYDPHDPSTYNVLQPSRPRSARWRPSWAEHLATYRMQYRFAVVLDYNLPGGVHLDGRQRVAAEPANTHKGGGIFLHVNGEGATAGCVSVTRPVMRAIVRWLDPTARPRIVMGPASQLTHL